MPSDITSVEMLNTIKTIDFGEKILIIKFGGPWCKACKELEKEMECIPDLVVFDVNVENDNFEEYITGNNIASIPYTIIIYKKNEINFKGVRKTDELTEMINLIKQ